MLPTTPSTETPLPPDFDQLVANLLAKPELASDPSAVSDEVLAELLKRLNPYSACVPNPPSSTFKQVVACSYTNLRDDYLRRFVVTAVTGFLFQVAGEWEPPAAARRWTPATRAAKDAAAVEPFAASALLERARAVVAVAEEASRAAEDSAAAREDARQAAAAALVAEEAAAQAKADGLTGSEADAKAAAAASAAADAKTAAATAGDAAARAAGLLYAATHLLAGAGGEADRRMHATAAAGYQYAAVREVLTQFPLPPPPAQVEAPVEVARGLVVDFLTRWLDFDPAKHVRAGRDRPAAAGASAATALAARAAAGATVAPAPLDPADPAHATLEELRAAPPAATAEHVESLSALIATPQRISAALAALRVGAGALAAAAPLLGACAATAASREAVDALVGNKPLADALAVASGALNQFANYFEPGVETTPAAEHAEAVQTIKSVAGGAAVLRAAVADPPLLAAAAALARLDVSAAADEPASATMAAVHTFLGNAEVGTAVAQAAATAESAAAFRAYLWPRAAAAVPTALRRLPPQDTFHRLNYYAEVNYEALRSVTEALYPERADLDWVIMPWAVFGGRPAEVDAEFDRFCSRHSEEFPSAVRSVDVGRWTFLGDFRGNRDKINFYNRNTEVLKRIMDRHEEDRKLGAELMRRRVEDKKLENIAEAGPDAPGLAGYRREAGGKGKTPAAMGAERVISAERMKRMEAARGDRAAMRELEHFDAYAARVAELEKQLGDRTPTDTEAIALAAARADLARAHEMLAVPGNAIQVDAFHFDAGTGEFGRKIMYTEAETPAETSERAAAAAAASAAPLPPLAPYAAAMLEADLAAEREADAKVISK